MLYGHQSKGVSWLTAKTSAGLFWEMGCGKSRTALHAAKRLYEAKKIDRVLVLAPAAVGIAWKEELNKLSLEGFDHNLLRYDPKLLRFSVESVGGHLNGEPQRHMPVAVVSYGLLSREHHAETVAMWAKRGKTVLICDESSFLKNRTAKQSKAAKYIASYCWYRWLLSGTPVCNSPLDLWSQGRVMAPGGGGPLAGFKNFYHFRAAYGTMGGFKMKQWFPLEEKLPDLQVRFAPFVSRVEKKDCLDLPEKSYTIREVALTKETWSIYQELKKEAMLVLGNGEARPEPNAAVRLLRLCQLTSGHLGTIWHSEKHDIFESDAGPLASTDRNVRDISSEKLDWLAEQVESGELSGVTSTTVYLSNTFSFSDRAQSEDRTHRPADKFINGMIIFCRWRRERERLRDMLGSKLAVYEIYGGQGKTDRECNIKQYTSSSKERCVCLAQPASGGYGLNLQSISDKVSYIDVVAVGPKGERTVDHHILKALRDKKSVAEWTCSAWKKVLEDE